MAIRVDDIVVTEKNVLLLSGGHQFVADIERDTDALDSENFSRDRNPWNFYSSNGDIYHNLFDTDVFDIRTQVLTGSTRESPNNARSHECIFMPHDVDYVANCQFYGNSYTITEFTTSTLTGDVNVENGKDVICSEHGCIRYENPSVYDSPTTFYISPTAIFTPENGVQYITEYPLNGYYTDFGDNESTYPPTLFGDSVLAKYYLDHDYSINSYDVGDNRARFEHFRTYYDVGSTGNSIYLVFRNNLNGIADVEDAPNSSTVSQGESVVGYFPVSSVAYMSNIVTYVGTTSEDDENINLYFSADPYSDIFIYDKMESLLTGLTAIYKPQDASFLLYVQKSDGTNTKFTYIPKIGLERSVYHFNLNEAYEGISVVELPHCVAIGTASHGILTIWSRDYLYDGSNSLVDFNPFQKACSGLPSYSSLTATIDGNVYRNIELFYNGNDILGAEITVANELSGEDGRGARVAFFSSNYSDDERDYEIGQFFMPAGNPLYEIETITSTIETTGTVLSSVPISSKNEETGVISWNYQMQEVSIVTGTTEITSNPFQLSANYVFDSDILFDYSSTKVENELEIGSYAFVQFEKYGLAKCYANDIYALSGMVKFTPTGPANRFDSRKKIWTDVTNGGSSYEQVNEGILGKANVFKDLKNWPESNDGERLVVDGKVCSLVEPYTKPPVSAPTDSFFAYVVEGNTSSWELTTVPYINGTVSSDAVMKQLAVSANDTYFCRSYVDDIYVETEYGNYETETLTGENTVYATYTYVVDGNLSAWKYSKDEDGGIRGRRARFIDLPGMSGNYYPHDYEGETPNQGDVMLLTGDYKFNDVESSEYAFYVYDIHSMHMDEVDFRFTDDPLIYAISSQWAGTGTPLQPYSQYYLYDAADKTYMMGGVIVEWNTPITTDIYAITANPVDVSYPPSYGVEYHALSVSESLSSLPISGTHLEWNPEFTSDVYALTTTITGGQGSQPPSLTQSYYVSGTEGKYVRGGTTYVLDDDVETFIIEPTHISTSSPPELNKDYYLYKESGSVKSYSLSTNNITRYIKDTSDDIYVIQAELTGNDSSLPTSGESYYVKDGDNYVLSGAGYVWNAAGNVYTITEHLVTDKSSDPDPNATYYYKTETGYQVGGTVIDFNRDYSTVYKLTIDYSTREWYWYDWNQDGNWPYGVSIGNMNGRPSHNIQSNNGLYPNYPEYNYPLGKDIFLNSMYPVDDAEVPDHAVLIHLNVTAVNTANAHVSTESPQPYFVKIDNGHYNMNGTKLSWDWRYPSKNVYTLEINLVNKSTTQPNPNETYYNSSCEILNNVVIYGWNAENVYALTASVVSESTSLDRNVLYYVSDGDDYVVGGTSYEWHNLPSDADVNTILVENATPENYTPGDVLYVGDYDEYESLQGTSGLELVWDSSKDVIYYVESDIIDKSEDVPVEGMTYYALSSNNYIPSPESITLVWDSDVDIFTIDSTLINVSSTTPDALQTYFSLSNDGSYVQEPDVVTARFDEYNTVYTLDKRLVDKSSETPDPEHNRYFIPIENGYQFGGVEDVGGAIYSNTYSKRWTPFTISNFITSNYGGLTQRIYAGPRTFGEMMSDTSIRTNGTYVMLTTDGTWEGNTLSRGSFYRFTDSPYEIDNSVNGWVYSNDISYINNLDRDEGDYFMYDFHNKLKYQGFVETYEQLTHMTVPEPGSMFMVMKPHIADNHTYPAFTYYKYGYSDNMLNWWPYNYLADIRGSVQYYSDLKFLSPPPQHGERCVVEKSSYYSTVEHSDPNFYTFEVDGNVSHWRYSNGYRDAVSAIVNYEGLAGITNPLPKPGDVYLVWQFYDDEGYSNPAHTFYRFSHEEGTNTGTWVPTSLPYGLPISGYKDSYDEIENLSGDVGSYYFTESYTDNLVFYQLKVNDDIKWCTDATFSTISYGNDHDSSITEAIDYVTSEYGTEYVIGKPGLKATFAKEIDDGLKYRNSFSTLPFTERSPIKEPIFSTLKQKLIEMLPVDDFDFALEKPVPYSMGVAVKTFKDKGVNHDAAISLVKWNEKDGEADIAGEVTTPEGLYLQYGGICTDVYLDGKVVSSVDVTTGKQLPHYSTTIYEYPHPCYGDLKTAGTGLPIFDGPISDSMEMDDFFFVNGYFVVKNYSVSVAEPVSSDQQTKDSGKTHDYDSGDYPSGGYVVTNFFADTGDGSGIPFLYETKLIESSRDNPKTPLDSERFYDFRYLWQIAPSKPIEFYPASVRGKVWSPYYPLKYVDFIKYHNGWYYIALRNARGHDSTTVGYDIIETDSLFKEHKPVELKDNLVVSDIRFFDTHAAVEYERLDGSRFVMWFECGKSSHKTFPTMYGESSSQYNDVSRGSIRMTKDLSVDTVARYDNVEVINSLNRFTPIVNHKSNLFSIRLDDLGFEDSKYLTDYQKKILRTYFRNTITEIVNSVKPAHTQLFDVYLG